MVKGAGLLTREGKTCLAYKRLPVLEVIEGREPLGVVSVLEEASTLGSANPAVLRD